MMHPIKRKNTQPKKSVNYIFGTKEKLIHTHKNRRITSVVEVPLLVSVIIDYSRYTSEKLKKIRKTHR